MLRSIEKKEANSRRRYSIFGHLSGFSLMLKCVPVSVIVILSISTASFTFGSFSVSVFAESVSSGSSDVTVRVKDIITLRILDSSATSEIDNLSLGLTPTPNGTFTKGSFNVDASTSNATGYKLYMTSIGKDHSEDYTTNLTNIDATVEDNIATLDNGVSITEADFRVRNSSYKNKWGYSLASLDVTDTSSITYTNIPAHNTNHEVGGSNSAVESDLTPVTIGVNVSNSVSSGTYKNALEFTAIANELPIDYKLSFSGNEENIPAESASTGIATNVPEDMTASTLAHSYSFDIPQTEPLLPKLGFIGWSTSPDTRTGNGSGPNGLYVYGDKLTLTVDDADPYSTEDTLYAVYGDFFTITYMQEMSSTICSQIYTPSNVIGTDANAIVKRADGTTSVSGAKSTTIVDTLAGYEAIVSSNNQPYVAQRTLSDIRDGKSYTIRKLADGNCWMTSNLAFGEAGKTYTLTHGNTNTVDDFEITKEMFNNTENMGQPRIFTIATSTYGNHYNWSMATLSLDAISVIQSLKTPTTSICSSGFAVPTKDQYQVIIDTYSNFTAYPAEFAVGGFWDGRYANQYGYYWTRTPAPKVEGLAYTAYLVNIAKNLPGYVNSSSVAYNGGISVRCLAL